MTWDMTRALQLAVKNIGDYGDTDIFPFPIENHIFHDCFDQTLHLLEDIHNNFDNYLTAVPPINNADLAPVGYTGFRWATQIDPIWNAYFLALVISLGEEIEAARLSVSEKRIFSYRFQPSEDTSALFNSEIGWVQFQEHSLEMAKNHGYVLICDISDFYSRIYHHRLENSLTQLRTGNDYHNRIKRLLQRFSNNNSYGLPVGGPAARLLAELLLNRTDRLFKDEGIEFCRFADDYHIFADSKEQAYQNLVLVSERLFRNEGLSLQKAKTRIMKTKEFISASEFHLTDDDEQVDEKNREARDFLRISLKYDPYSQTAAADYEELRNEVEQYDIVGMLVRELAKTRIHSALTKKLVSAVRFLSDKARDQAVQSLIDNLEVLAPTLSVVLITIRSVYSTLSERVRDDVCETLKRLIQEESHLMQVDINLSYAIRVLAVDYSDDKEVLFSKIYKRSINDAVRRDIILAMAIWGASHWISDRKNYYANLSQWEKRAFIVASYVLGDEGRHWRDHAKGEFSSFDKLYRDWASIKADGNGGLKFNL